MIKYLDKSSLTLIDTYHFRYSFPFYINKE